jgi:hypothetical protein
MRKTKYLLAVMLIVPMLFVPVDADVEIDPGTMYAFYENAVNEIFGTIYLGNIGGTYSVNDIDLATVRINSVIYPVSMSIIDDYPGISGDVLIIEMDMSVFVAGYVPLWDTTTQVFSISGQYTDAVGFSFDGGVTMIGHISGDANGDGIVNLFDITYMLAYIYLGGPAPRLLDAADVDGSGSVNIQDASYLVSFLYFDGPPPVEH